MIEQASIDRVIETAQAVDVIGDYVTLRKRGANFMGLCPFHNEKSSSFSVSPSKNIFKCFGCGKAGNVVTFVMEQEQITFTEAIRQLAKRYNIELEETHSSQEEFQKRNERESLFLINDFARKWFSESLTTHREGIAVGLSYFRERGFRDDTIAKFGLGYSLDDYEAFTKAALNAGFKIEYIQKVGLTTVREDGRYFDRYRGRVIFPIQSVSGKVLGFGGRILKEDKEKKLAKYVNSPESEIYNKSETLYGIFQAKKSIQQKDKCYLVEGYIDVTSMSQAGIENVVASSGTSLTIGQIRLVRRFSHNITLIYDGDPAGIKAALRGIDLLLEEDINVRVILLPDGHDPDSFSKTLSSADFQNYLDSHEQDFVQFKTELLLKDAGKDPIKRAGIISDIVNTISLIPNQILRSVYIKNSSQLLSIEEQTLFSQVAQNRRQKQLKGEHKKTLPPAASTLPTDIPLPPPPSSDFDFLPPPPPEELGFATDAIVTEHIPAQPVVESTEFDSSEQEILKLLLLFGDKPMQINGDTTSVDRYIAYELLDGEMAFMNSFYRQIFNEYIEQSATNTREAIERYFIHHQNPSIALFTTNLLTSGIELSKIWTSKESYVTTPELVAEDLVRQTMLSYKLRRVTQIIKSLNQQMKELYEQERDNIAKQNELMHKFMQWSHFKILLDKELGGLGVR